MVDRVKITSDRITLRNSSDIIVFDTVRNYIKQDPSGILKVGGYDKMPSVYGYTQGNIIDHDNGGCWVYLFVESAGAFGPPPYSLSLLPAGFTYPYDYTMNLGLGVNYMKFNTAVDYTAYPSFCHTVSRYEMYNKYAYGDTWVPAVDANGQPLYYRWVVTAMPADGVTYPEKLWPQFCTLSGYPLDAIVMKHACTVKFKFNTLDRTYWGRLNNGQGTSYLDYYEAYPWHRWADANIRFGLKTLGIMSVSNPVSLSGTITT